MRLVTLASTRSPLGDVAIGSLQWAVGAFCTLIGALMLVTPHYFGATYAALRPHPIWWGALFLLTGAALLGVAALTPRRPLIIAVHLLAGAVLLIMAWGFGTVGGWNRASNYAVLAVGTAVAPLLARSSRRPWTDGSDLLAIVMGAASTLNGLLLVAADEAFGTVASDPASGWYGVAFLVSGVALVASQLHPSPRAAVVLAHLVAGGTLVIYLAAAAVAPRGWASIVYYGGFGVVVAVLPWLTPRLRLVDPRSLPTRLALALAIATALPLAAGLALAAHREERSARAGALQVQQTRAAALADHVADAVSLHRAAVTTLAAQPGLVEMDPEPRRTLLAGLSAAHPDLLAVSIHDAAGDRIDGGGSRAPAALAGTALFEQVRRTGDVALDLGMSPLVSGPVIELGAPIRRPDGRFAGLALGMFSPGRLAALLARAAAGGDTVYVVDGHGRLLAHGNMALVGASAASPAAGLLAPGTESGSLSYRAQDDEWLAGYAQVPGVGWTVIEEQPAAAALIDARADNDLYLGVLLLFIGAAATVGVFAASWLAAPLRALSRAVLTLEAGDHTTPLPRSRLSEVAHLASVFGDMRERLATRTAERERAEQERLRLLLEIDRERTTLAGIMASMSDGLVVVNAAREIRYCNAQAAELLGVDARALLGRPAEAAFGVLRRSLGRSPDGSGATWPAWQQALDTFETRPRLELALDGPPRRDVSVQLFPVSVAGTGRGVGILLHDVTAERELQRTKDELVSIVSHELRTPLASVIGFAELLLMRDWDEAKRREFLTVMVAEGRRLTALVNDFLNLQRMESGSQPVVPSPTALEPILERAVRTAGDDALRPIVVDVADGLPAVRADADRVQQVVTNLLSNARKYSPRGGTVRLAARTVDSGVEVTVSDHGLGIPPEALPRLFEKFYRVDQNDRRAIPGTGLGLAIVQQIVAAHGGRVWAESAGLGQGARFGFTLPIAEPAVGGVDGLDARSVPRQRWVA